MQDMKARLAMAGKKIQTRQLVVLGAAEILHESSTLKFDYKLFLVMN